MEQRHHSEEWRTIPSAGRDIRSAPTLGTLPPTTSPRRNARDREG